MQAAADASAVGAGQSGSVGPARADGASARFGLALFALFLGLPVLTLVVRSIVDGSLSIALASPEVLDALWLSLFTTAISLVLTVTLGLPLAFVLARRSFRGSGLVQAVVDLPIVLPPSVAGLPSSLSSVAEDCSRRAFEVLGISVPFTTIAVILAQTSCRPRSSSVRRAAGSPAWTVSSRTPHEWTALRNATCSAR